MSGHTKLIDRYQIVYCSDSGHKARKKKEVERKQQDWGKWIEIGESTTRSASWRLLAREMGGDGDRQEG